MKFKLILFALVFSFSFTPSTMFSQSGGVEVLGNWTNPNLPYHSFGQYNEVWGIEVNGHEYAVIGSIRGTHFIDLDSNPLQEIYFIAGRDSVGNNIHRDYHSYGNYLYAVCDEGESSLQVMDFSGLPNKVELVYDSDEFLVRSHNIFIDEDNARLYSTRFLNWYLSLDDPANPVKVDLITSDSPPPSMHDLYVRDNIVYANCQSQGLWVYDVSNPSDYKLLGNLTSYPNQGYNHSGWLNDAGTHYFLCEETTGADLKSIDITDPTDMEIKKRFNVGTPYANLPHNSMVTGNYLYVSYYYDGLQVYDISNPEEPFRAAFYDTFDGSNNGFQGAWGVYSKLPSGRILVSDMSNGLFLLDVTPGNYPTDATLESSSSNIVFCENINLTEWNVTIGSGFSDAGVTLDFESLPNGVTVEYSSNPAAPGSTVTISLTGLTSDASLILTAIDDLGNSYFLDFFFEVENLPSDVVTPLEPANGSSNVGVMPEFSWDGTLFAIYHLEIATDSNDFEGSLVYTATIPNARSFEMPDELFSGTYYWRLYIENECGKAYSEVFEFHTTTVATNNLEESSFSVFPNPAKDQIFLEFAENTEGLAIQLMDVQGRQMAYQFLENGQTEAQLLVEGLTGIYFLQVKGEGIVLTKKVVVSR